MIGGSFTPPTAYRHRSPDCGTNARIPRAGVSRRAPALAVLRGDRSLFTEIAALASHVLPKRAFWEATRLSTYANSLISMVGAYGLEPWVVRPWTGFRTGFQSFAWRCLERLQKHLPERRTEVARKAAETRWEERPARVEEE
jgi:hypothetical protein